VTAAIFDVKFRCKVIRHLMSNSVSEMPIFGVLGDFSVGGRDLLTFLVHYEITSRPDIV